MGKLVVVGVGAQTRSLTDDSTSGIQYDVAGVDDRANFAESIRRTAQLEIRSCSLTYVQRRREEVGQVAGGDVRDVNVRRLVSEHSCSTTQSGFALPKTSQANPILGVKSQRL